MKKIVIISTLLSAAFLAGCGSTAVQTGQTPTGQIPAGQTPKACTMDAKACPDGSYVGRTGPNCEFAACPISGEETACGVTPSTTCAGTGK
jgi:hypothetical protein